MSPAWTRRHLRAERTQAPRLVILINCRRRPHASLLAGLASGVILCSSLSPSNNLRNDVFRSIRTAPSFGSTSTALGTCPFLSRRPWATVLLTTGPRTLGPRVSENCIRLPLSLSPWLSLPQHTRDPPFWLRPRSLKTFRVTFRVLLPNTKQKSCRCPWDRLSYR